MCGGGGGGGVGGGVGCVCVCVCVGSVWETAFMLHERQGNRAKRVFLIKSVEKSPRLALPSASSFNLMFVGTRTESVGVTAGSTFKYGAEQSGGGRACQPISPFISQAHHSQS